MIRVIAADNHPLIEHGLISIFRRSDIRLVGFARDGHDLLFQVRELKPDVVLTDLPMPEMDGIQATRKLLQEWRWTTPVIAFSEFAEAALVALMKAAGARGYLLKTDSKEMIIAAVRAVHAGLTYFSPRLELPPTATPANLLRKYGAVYLSPIEVEVLVLVSRQHSSAQIAGRLGLSVPAVESHRRDLMRKTGSLNVAGLVRYATEQGIIPPYRD